eukprot:10298413-Alexandrium_andersonii.AAC.1
MRGSIDDHRAIAGGTSGEAKVGLVPAANWAPVNCPFGVRGGRHGPVADDGRPGDSGLAGPGPFSDGSVSPHGQHDDVRPLGVPHARGAAGSRGRLHVPKSSRPASTAARAGSPDGIIAKHVLVRACVSFAASCCTDDGSRRDGRLASREALPGEHPEGRL